MTVPDDYPRSELDALAAITRQLDTLNNLLKELITTIDFQGAQLFEGLNQK